MPENRLFIAVDPVDLTFTSAVVDIEQEHDPDLIMEGLNNRLDNKEGMPVDPGVMQLIQEQHVLETK